MQPPVTYQGGKHRIASAIADHLQLRPHEHFYDFCCGGGSISIEFRNRGVDVSRLTMVDCGPWGMVWQAIGTGTYDLSRFRLWCDEVPTDLTKVRGFAKALYETPVDDDAIYVFPLLQAACFGGKPIWIDCLGSRWCNGSWRDYWLPTATSNRQSPVNPMMPMPNTIYERMAALCQGMLGVQGLCLDVREVVLPVSAPPEALVYMDPPYEGTTPYGYDFDPCGLARTLPARVFVSEARALSEDATLISEPRKKGGISGKRKGGNEEWLSRVPSLLDSPVEDS